MRYSYERYTESVLNFQASSMIKVKLLDYLALMLWRIELSRVMVSPPPKMFVYFP